MGVNQSSPSEHPISSLGVGTLVREIGMAMIPIHLRHSLESIMQILGELELNTKYKIYINIYLYKYI